MPRITLPRYVKVCSPKATVRKPMLAVESRVAERKEHATTGMLTLIRKIGARLEQLHQEIEHVIRHTPACMRARKSS